MPAANPEKRTSRRAFLRVCLAGCGALTMAACWGQRVLLTPPPLTEEKTPATSAPATPTNVDLQQMERYGLFTVLAGEGDRVAAHDVAVALQAQAEGICARLHADSCALITVELYPDQAAFDRHAMNPAMAGYYAVSGQGRIQMVSPVNPTPHVDLPYAERVLIAVHEYVHLVNDEINPEMPLWLDEGVACYTGPSRAYAEACRQSFPCDAIPRLQDLQTAYGSVPVADLFSYALVEFIAAEWGDGTLNDLLRNPALEETLGLPQAEIEARWRRFMAEHYGHGGQ